MSPCRAWTDRLSDLALGALKASEARAVEAHVRACAPCAAALAELRARGEKINAAVRQLVEEARPSPAFHAGVLAKLETLAVPGAWRLWRAPSWPRRAGALAAVVVAILVLAALRPGLRRLRPGFAPPAPQPAASLSSWRSPTEVLLRSPDDQLLRSAPRLGQLYFRLEPARKFPGKRNGGNTNET